MKDTIAYDVAPITVADAVAERAAATVRRHALDAADRRELLDALGLPDVEGLALDEGPELGRPVDNGGQGDAEQDGRMAGYRALAAAVLAADGLENEGGGSGG